MNVAELFGIVYLAIVAGGSTGADAWIAIGMVGVWMVLGFVWIALNPATKGQRLIADPKAAA